MFLIQGHSLRAQRQALDGVVRLAAAPPPPAAAALEAHRAPAHLAVSEAPAPAGPELCLDTCFKARDGVCDDGRFLPNITRGLAVSVQCDLGTDCADCGPWRGAQHSGAW